MDKAVNVAVVRSDNRRGAVAQALALIANDLQSTVASHTLIKPNLVSHRRQLPSTHADALSATIDAILAAGAKKITIAEGASCAQAGFERFGYRRETFARPVEFFDINSDETDWCPLPLMGSDGSPLEARLSSTVADSQCRVSLAVPKTHVSSILTLSLKNMLSSIHPADRVMMHGSRAGGNGYQGWRRLLVEFLKGDSVLVNGLTRTIGRARNLKSWVTGQHRADACDRFSAREQLHVRSVDVLSRNIATLSKVAKPHVSVIDGFVAMHREGPRHGSPIPLGVVVAGTDAVACDAVMAAIMGFNPLKIGHLAYAEAAGLGTANLETIRILGDPIASVRRRCVAHSTTVISRYWDRPKTIKGPHATARSHDFMEAR